MTQHVPWTTLGPVRGTELVVTRLVPQWRRRLRRYPGVASVVVGSKRVGGQIRHAAVPCLKFFVHRKGEFDWTRRLPEFVTLRLSATRITRVPTDVEEIPQLIPQVRTTAARLRADDVGSTGFRVRKDGVEWLVSAAHVLEQGSAYSGAAWEKSGVLGEGRVDESSCWRLRTDPKSGKRGFVDAGLVRIDRAGILDDLVRHPRGSPAVAWDELHIGMRVAVCGQHGVARGRIDALVETEEPAQLGRPQWRYMRYAFTSGETNAGDSGAPVLGPGDSLVGMHFAIEPDPQTGEPRGVALSAGDLLEHFGATLA
jgi:hypothetical protein